MLFASAGQVNVQVPWEVGPGFVTVAATVRGVPGFAVGANIVTAAPGVFATVHANGGLVNAANPAVAGETLVVYGTGLGPVSGTVATGQPASSTTLQSVTQPLSVTIDGTPATVSFAGLTPGFLGLYQINVVVPRLNAPGPQSTMLISAAGAISPSTPLPAR
jgi:uncharacterized protein (TIGR03437 family)